MTGPRTITPGYRHFAREGWDEGGQYAATVRAATGLDLMPRGDALARYVTQRLTTVMTARSIATAVGYTVTRCADLLASGRNAPLGRRLLDRDAIDQLFHSPILPPPPPEPLNPRTSRPAPSGDEILWEVEDAHLRGDTLADVAAMFGVDQATLRRWVRRGGIIAQVETYYPRRVAGVASAVPTRRRCNQGHVMVVTPGGRPRCRECKRASEKRRRVA